jgi:hypothetical protein
LGTVHRLSLSLLSGFPKLPSCIPMSISPRILSRLLCLTLPHCNDHRFPIESRNHLPGQKSLPFRRMRNHTASYPV